MEWEAALVETKSAITFRVASSCSDGRIRLERLHFLPMCALRQGFPPLVPLFSVLKQSIRHIAMSLQLLGSLGDGRPILDRRQLIPLPGSL